MQFCQYTNIKQITVICFQLQKMLDHVVSEIQSQNDATGTLIIFP